MVTTRNGYDLFELLSALQKDIRRGNEEQALIWAIELEHFNSQTLWNRLQIIASEDIGPATNEIAILTEILEQKYWRFKKKGNDGYREFIIHAVVAMCRATKTRVCDELALIIYPKVALGHNLPPIPSYAKDMHTRAGKAQGKGIEDFYAEGAVINPMIHSPYTERSKEAEEKYKFWWKDGLGRKDMNDERENIPKNGPAQKTLEES